METALTTIQLILGLSICNVWILRLGKNTNWRGGTAATMREEFAVYGLPGWFMVVVGCLKRLCAAALITGIWLPAFVKPAAIGLAILMSGAVAMHLKVRDSRKKYIPSGILLILSVLTATI